MTLLLSISLYSYGHGELLLRNQTLSKIIEPYAFEDVAPFSGSLLLQIKTFSSDNATWGVLEYSYAIEVGWNNILSQFFPILAFLTAMIAIASIGQIIYEAKKQKIDQTHEVVEICRMNKVEYSKAWIIWHSLKYQVKNFEASKLVLISFFLFPFVFETYELPLWVPNFDFSSFIANFQRGIRLMFFLFYPVICAILMFDFKAKDLMKEWILPIEKTYVWISKVVVGIFILLIVNFASLSFWFVVQQMIVLNVTLNLLFVLKYGFLMFLYSSIYFLVSCVLLFFFKEKSLSSIIVLAIGYFLEENSTFGFRGAITEWNWFHPVIIGLGFVVFSVLSFFGHKQVRGIP